MKKITARILTGILLALGSLYAGNILMPASSPLITNVYADPAPEDTDTPDNIENTPGNTDEPSEPVEIPDEEDTPSNGEERDENSEEENEKEDEDSSDKDACQEQVGSLSWIVCPTSSIIAGATDSIYSAIEDMLVVNPVSMQKNSPIYLVWEYLRSLTNIIFIICLLIVIYSQLTGMGLQNYGIKRVLPRLVISVVLVNLSFIICALAVDVSNVIGDSLRGTFATIGEQTVAQAEAGEAVQNFHLSEFLAKVVSGGTIAGFTIGALGGGGYIFYMLLIVLIGAIVAVVTGLITIAARQAVVALLIMISPLAFVAYLLPNTEKWFEKWKDLFFRMLIFYPMFSFLFGASQLVGYTLILAANNTFGIILGVAVQIFPLFFGWSLMKMSGTILGSLNSGLRKLVSPVQNSLAGWSASRAEQHRQHHIASSTMPGAKLRRYLDYRQSLRELDIKNSSETRHNRALEAAYKTASSSRGYDDDGNLRWDPIANRYTKNAKLSGLYQTRLDTAEKAYKNTLTAYGRTFGASAAATRLSNAHSEAYKDNMAQQFLTANEAQADQEFLLGQYLTAQNNQAKNPYEFNRLIKNAAGTLGHTGESSIMGQVIIGNSTIENRRRTEARIMITKFGINKPQARGMFFDTEHINDNGIETDAHGKEIQDDQYRMLPGQTHTPWQQYIGRHKITGDEITKEEYDNLSDIERNMYNRIKFFNITDDAGRVVQHVYDDDAGYMKEILSDDLAIGDPINDRYLTEIGVAHARGEKTGILRKYHSTIIKEILGYGEHNAADTAMIAAQANLGFITSPGQLSIAQLQSLNVASKPGKILINDSIFLDKWREIICSAYGLGDNPKDFEYFFSDEDIYNYRNVNGDALKGLRLVDSVDENGNTIKKWEEVSHKELEELSYNEVLEYRKNYLKHNIIPKCISKLIGSINRHFTPNVMDSQKPSTLKALDELASILIDANNLSSDPSRAFEDLPNGNANLMSEADAYAMVKKFQQAAEKLAGTTQANQSSSSSSSASGSGSSSTSGGSNSSSSSSSNSGSNNSGSNPGGSGGSANSNQSHSTTAGRRAIDDLAAKFERDIKYQQAYDERNDINKILTDIEDIFLKGMGFNAVESAILSYFETTEILGNFTTACEDIFDSYRNELMVKSSEEVTYKTANYHQIEEEILEKIKAEVINLVISIPHPI